MNLKVPAVLFVGLTLFLLVGCRTGSVMDIRDAGIPAAVGKSLTMDDVAKGILAAGSKQGWAMAIQTQGHIVGTLVLRKHSAAVDVFYSTSSYSILYKDSVNLNYDPATKTIHSNYSSWVRNLHAAIQKEFGEAVQPD